VARAAVLVPDLMLGSRVIELLRAGGHELVDADDAEVLVVDVMAIEPEGVPRAGARCLGIYAHTQPDVRDRALRAGFDLVVPRSRMVREGAQLVAELASRA
jgi:hypothetical protein